PSSGSDPGLMATAYDGSAAVSLSRAVTPLDRGSSATSLQGVSDSIEPAGKLGQVDRRFRASPPRGPVGGEIEHDPGDPRPDHRPERPADVGHDRVEPDAGHQRLRRLAEVCPAELLQPGVVIVELATGVPELERGVAVAAVLPVHQPEPPVR